MRGTGVLNAPMHIQNTLLGAQQEFTFYILVVYALENLFPISYFFY